MVASLSLRVYTGSAAGTESSAVTGIDLISADNATNSLANRQANPITVGTRSYEKWLKLKIDTAPTTQVTNFKMWGDGALATSTSLYFTAGAASGITPTNANSTVATYAFTGFTANAKATWDTAAYTATNATTKYAVFQLAVDADCAPGYWNNTATGAETVNYSYDET
jgi:hypothetical protein